MGKYLDEAMRVRPLIERAAQSLSDADALTAATLYPRWEDLVKQGSVEAPEGLRFRGSDGKLYRCRKENPTFQSDWIPGLNTNALYVRVGDDAETGTIDNPIEADKGMEYVYGLYYRDPTDGQIYKCQRTGEPEGSTIVLAYLPSELIGIYFEEAAA